MAKKTMVHRLLESSNTLLKSKPNSAAYRRRAVSAAYYAVFHALAGLCADQLLVSGRNKEAKLRIYRALDHGALKNAFQQAPLKDHPQLKELGALIRRLQEERHNADYLPPDRNLFPKNEVQQIIEQANLIVGKLEGLDSDSRLLLATCLLFKERRQ